MSYLITAQQKNSSLYKSFLYSTRRIVLGEKVWPYDIYPNELQTCSQERESFGHTCRWSRDDHEFPNLVQELELHRDRFGQYCRMTVVEFEALLVILTLHLNELLTHCFSFFCLSLYCLTSEESSRNWSDNHFPVGISHKTRWI